MNKNEKTPLLNSPNGFIINCTKCGTPMNNNYYYMLAPEGYILDYLCPMDYEENVENKEKYKKYTFRKRKLFYMKSKKITCPCSCNIM